MARIAALAVEKDVGVAAGGRVVVVRDHGDVKATAVHAVRAVRALCVACRRPVCCADGCAVKE